MKRSKSFADLWQQKPESNCPTKPERDIKGKGKEKFSTK